MTRDMLQDRCRELVEELGLGTAGEVRNITPLTGGVASDIARFDIGNQTLCAKFALPKLKVAADWFAPVHRNTAEYAWLQVAARIAPDTAVRLMGRSERLHGFAMEYLSGETVYLWKESLLDNAPNRSEATRVGALIGKIQAASAAAGFDTGPFRNIDDFHALRIEPYLVFTATRHPDLSARLNALAERLYTNRQVLVHGDVSPKNILFRDSGPIILDAECATMGDPGFDPAFCMNHLILKAVHVREARRDYLERALEFWDAYAPHITWEPPAATGAHVAALLPALMLARVDGKSPVEYLSDPDRRLVRDCARKLIADPADTVPDLIAAIGTELGQGTA